MPKRVLPTILGDRVQLRPLGPADLPQTLEWRNQDHIRRWFVYSQPLSLEQHSNWYRKYAELDTDFVFVIEERGSPPRRVGQIALYNIDWEQGTAEFGRLMLGEASAGGRGLAREAAEVICHWGFEFLQLNQIHLEVFAENARAIRLYEGLGFELGELAQGMCQMHLRRAA